MALELPSYRVPDLKSALLLTADRGLVFLKKAGTLIVAISIVLWWLNAYPHTQPSQQVQDLRNQAVLSSDTEQIAQLEAQADELEAREAASNSFLGRIGSSIQPVFAPLGYNDQLTVGVLASFAAREVFVSTMAVQVAGNEDFEDATVLDSIENARRADGSMLFNTPTAWSLLVFYVFASLCLPTTVVTAKESGAWRWALLQLGWMSCVAYAGAFAAYHIAAMVGG